MDVYVDESGDLGFKTSATKYFVVAFITCDSSLEVSIEMNRLLKKLHKKGQYNYNHNELKFSKMNDYSRKKVLEKINELNCNKGVIIVEKHLVNPKLRDDPVTLYNYLVVHNVMSALFPQLISNGKMHLVMDKSKPKNKIEAFNEYVRNKASYMAFTNGKKLPNNCVTAEHLDSVNEPCLQAVDSISGAFFQAYENSKPFYQDIIKDKMNYVNKLWR